MSYARTLIFYITAGWKNSCDTGFCLQAADRGVSGTVAGWVFGCFALTQFIFSPIFGYFVSKYVENRSPVFNLFHVGRLVSSIVRLC